MLSHISSKARTLWKKMSNKEYRDAFTVAHNSNTISSQIHAMRRSRRLTQGELAEKCGMKQPRISALEDPDFENVEIATLQRLASAFDVGLLVAFVPFSDIARRATSLSNADFNVCEFALDSIDSLHHKYNKGSYNTTYNTADFNLNKSTKIIKVQSLSAVREYRENIGIIMQPSRDYVFEYTDAPRYHQ